jgi:hypothetical protein
MTKKLLVVTDLGRFKAYRLEKEKDFTHPRLELLEDLETNVTHHLREQVTDQAGQYRRGGPNGEGATPLSDGEPHNLDLERRRRALKTVAKRISQLLSVEDVDGCYLAADSQINKAILAEMDERTRAKIQINIAANLTRLSPLQVAEHFRQ